MTPARRRSGLTRAALACLCALGAGLPAAGLRAQEAAFAVQDVTLQNVVIDLGGTRLVAPVLTASGTGLSRDDLQAILRRDGREPWPARLARLDAGSIAIPELRVERAASGEGAARTGAQTAVYRNVVARGVHGGRIAELTSSGTSLTVAAAAEGSRPAASGTYGPIRAEEVDLAGLARLAIEPGDGKGPLRRLLATLSVESIAFVDAHGTRVSLARAAGRDLSGRQVPGGWDGAAAILRGFDHGGADAAARARAAGAAADLLEAFSVGGFEATGLRVQDPPDRSATGGKEPGRDAAGSGRAASGDVTVGRIAYAPSGSEAGFTLSDVGFSGADTRLHIGRLALTGSSLEPTVAALRRAAAPPGKPADRAGEGAAGTDPADLRRLTPTIGTLSLSGFSLDLADEEKVASTDPMSASRGPGTAGKSDLGKSGPAANTLHVGLREAALRFGPPRDGVPGESRLSLSGLSLPASVVAGVPGLGSLGAYGYRDLDLDATVDSAWNEAARELALREVAITGHGMGTLRLDGLLGGIGPDVFDPDAAVSGLAMLSATAKALTLRVENGGFYERFIEATAKSLSLKPDELRKEYVTACLIGIPVILGNSAPAKAIGAAMAKFAAKPGTLAISARAKNPTGLGVVDFSTAPSPGAMLDKLDVTAKAD